MSEHHYTGLGYYLSIKSTIYALRYTPNIQLSRRIASPHAIPRLSLMTFSLLPITSFQPTATSAMGIFALSANMSISTSKIQPSLCIYGMIYGSAARENSLKPH